MVAPPQQNPRTGLPPAPLAGIGARVDDRLRRLLVEQRNRWSAVDELLGAPLDALIDFATLGGKRLRPAFCHWGFVGAGGDPEDPMVIDAGAALELLHAFALIHDDVMDASDTRRGNDTVHIRFGRDHLRGGWNGEARRFGEGVAVLLGDLAFVEADLLLTEAPAPARRLYGELRRELVAGQFLDVIGAARGVVDAERSQRISVFKSGKYTVERPLHLGAALAGRLDELGPTFSAYGLPLGEAFQLRDDLLGAFGDAAVTGKPVGEDLREGKPTRLVTHAVAAATEQADVAALEVLGRLGDPNLDEAGVARIQEVLEDTGARTHVEARVSELVDRAFGALDDVVLDGGARLALVELAEFCAYRAK